MKKHKQAGGTEPKTLNDKERDIALAKKEEDLIQWAARQLIGPKIRQRWVSPERRFLELSKITGMRLDDYKSLKWLQEFFYLWAAAEMKKESEKGTGDINKESMIPFSIAIEISNGVLTTKILNKAIKDGKPIKVRHDKPSKNRKNVHIQDVLLLIRRLSDNDKATEETARMFGEYKNQLQTKASRQINLE